MPRKGFLYAKKKFNVKAKKNLVWKKLMENQNISTALNKKYEETAVFGKLKELAKDGLYVNEVREFSERLAHGREKLDHINWKEARQIAKGFKEELYPGLKIYKYSNLKAKAKSTSDSERPNRASTSNSSQLAEKPITPVQMATIMNRVRKNPADTSGEGGVEDSKGRFGSAMAATMRNKRG